VGLRGPVVVTQDATDENGTLGLDDAWVGIVRLGLATMPHPILLAVEFSLVRLT
jgi:hypothetical protein